MRTWFDMETGDPDDFLTLALLCGHPAVELIGVSVTPGTPHQVGVVRHCLDRFELDLPVGVFDLDHRKGRGTPHERVVTCVSAWHERMLGPIPPSRDAVPAGPLLAGHLGPDTTLITGAPLKNIGALLRELSLLREHSLLRGHRPGRSLGRLFVQGGFAGEGVVPAEDQLPRFRGLTTCPTYNLNGDVKSALAVLECPDWTERRFVSKNVCHGVIYDAALHERVLAVPDPQPGLALIAELMETSLRRRPSGKKLHDPLAACCAIDPTIARWAEVELYRKRGGWGARLKPGSGTQIITGLDFERFVTVFTAGRREHR